LPPKREAEISAPLFEAFEPISYPEDEEGGISPKTFAAALENLKKLR